MMLRVSLILFDAIKNSLNIFPLRNIVLQDCPRCRPQFEIDHAIRLEIGKDLKCAEPYAVEFGADSVDI